MRTVGLAAALPAYRPAVLRLWALEPGADPDGVDDGSCRPVPEGRHPCG